MLGLLRRLHPRVAVVAGCAMLALAGMAAGLAWFGTLPPREHLLHLTGLLQEMRTDGHTGTFQIKVLSDGALRTFDFENGLRLGDLARESLKEGQRDIAVALAYFERGRKVTVVDVVIGKSRVLSYDEVARLAAKKVTKDRNSAIGFGGMGTLLISLGGLARLARGGSHQPAASSPDTTVGALIWLVFYGLILVVMLTEPATLHGAFGVEAFGLPIEYVLPAALALVLLPLWPGCMGFASLVRQAMGKGRSGKLGMILELRSALASDDPAQRRMAIGALWFVAYFVLLVGAWIAYAAMIGI